VNPSEQNPSSVEHDALFPPTLNSACFVRSTPATKSASLQRTQTQADVSELSLRDSWGEDPERWDGMS